VERLDSFKRLPQVRAFALPQQHPENIKKPR
jgi:hypothetical protein